MAIYTPDTQQVSDTGRGLMEGGTNRQLAAAEFDSIDNVLQAANLDFHIGRSAVAYRSERDGEWKENPNVKQMFRTDTGAFLGGPVSNLFKPAQPFMLAQVIDELQPNGYRIAGAVSLVGGEGMVFILKKDGFNLSGDVVEHTLIISTDNTGKASTVFCQSTNRLICLNQLPAMFGNSKYKISVRHTTQWSDAYKSNIVHQLKDFSAAADNLEIAADRMASTGMTDKQAVNYFAELYVERDEKNNITNESSLERIVNKVMDCYKHGPGANHVAARGTQWGAINAVTNYIDYHTRARSGENRFKSATIGAGFARKEKAVKLIEQLSVAPPAFDVVSTQVTH